MSEWISVKERLPEPLANILCYFANEHRTDISWMDHSGYFAFEESYGKVTHWMPLPPPPGEEDA